MDDDRRHKKVNANKKYVYLLSLLNRIVYTETNIVCNIEMHY